MSRLPAVAVIAAAAAICGPAAAQTLFETAREFVLDRQCDAYRSFKKATGATPLEISRHYPGRGVNRPDNPSHVFIRVGEQSLWVDLACGHFADGDGAVAAPAPAAGERTAGGPACLPFFDDVDNPVPRPLRVGGKADITPPPPPLDAFDKAVMAACGPAGKSVTRDEFKALMLAHADVLARLKAFTAGRVFADRPQRFATESYLDDLADAWFDVKAFDHVMCGQPGEGGRIGGLHFAGRYLQLQQSGEACRMANYGQNEVVPGLIYTFGAEIRTATGTWRHSTKGYGYTLSAEEMIKAATRALAENPTESSESRGCLLSLTDDDRPLVIVFVRRAQGIRTFYPDATPNSRGDKPSPPCAAPVSLQ